MRYTSIVCLYQCWVLCHIYNSLTQNVFPDSLSTCTIIHVNFVAFIRSKNVPVIVCYLAETLPRGIWWNNASLNYIHWRCNTSCNIISITYKITFSGFITLYTIHIYSGPPLIRTPLLPSNSVLIREVSFGEREHYVHSQYLLPEICVLYRGVSSLQSVL